MDAVVEFVTGLPVEILLTAGAVLVAFLIIVISALVSRRRFIRRVERFREIPGARSVSDFFTSAELLRRTRLLERMIDRMGTQLVTELELDRLWTERLYQSERPGDFRRVLAYGTSKGLFACFLAALRNRRLADALRAYLKEHSDFLVLRRLALSGRGEEFSGERAAEFFGDRIGEIREMTGDPEWPSRYFAVKILLHDDDDRSRRALRDAFGDPHPLVRKTVATGFSAAPREELAAILTDLFLHDPVFEVRHVARQRLRQEFSDLYSLNASELAPEEAIHVVGLLDASHEDDVNAALEYLAGGNLEIKLAAARFLDRHGTLRNLFLSVSFADREELMRVRTLLASALAVHVTGFLEAVRDNPGPESLLIAGELLREHGPQELIVELAERVFRLQETTDHHLEIYQATVAAIHARGDDAAQTLLAKEIGRRSDRPELLRIALDGVAGGHDSIYRDTLTAALRDPTVPEREALRNAFARLDTPYVLTTCIDIITAGRERNPHVVRIDALLTLGALKLEYTLQDILEHLPILPVDVAREFTRTLHEFQPSELERKVRMMLEGVDGNIRASVIAALPATGKKTFLSEIKSALQDADPDVRIAAAWSLVDYEETRALNQAVSMLRDPVERVRESVARALAIGGGKTAMEALRDTLADENEVDVVKRAAIEGLAASTQREAVDVLVEALETDGELCEAVERGLAAKTEATAIKRLVEHFKDAEPAVRDRIAHIFSEMGESGESAVRQVLDEEIAGLRATLAEILETTGYVESRIRLLNHRDPRVRRDAADFLALVGSEAAFRGIVLAARDPDPDVRVQVTKALERLASDDGREILHALESDPDRRIRKYTHWALERLDAKAL